MLAINKAKIISNKFPDHYIIGADTIVYYNNMILNKPINYTEAIKYLKLLNGNKHIVYTGVSLINKKNNLQKSFVEKTSVYFNDLTNNDIKNYVKTCKPFDKAGAYGIQDMSSIFIKKINGCFYNVVGFPLSKFYKLFSADLNLKL
tara:strand:+ start:177 stop:614 length:438 start_codon:yes stop_codon:yes gene_type:complete